jgi:hypothetical protein
MALVYNVMLWLCSNYNCLLQLRNGAKAGLVSWTTVFDSISVHVEYLVNKLALRQGFLVYCVLPVRITPPLLHTEYFNPLTPELNPYGQRCLLRILLGILVF